MPVRTILRFPGGKARLSRFIVNQFPEHTVYVEPFAGGASVLMLKEPVRLEILNDINKNIYYFFDTLKHNHKALKFLVEHTPYSREVFNEAREAMKSPENLAPVQRAFYLIVLCKMSTSACLHSFAVPPREVRCANKESWLGLEEIIPVASKRLKHCVIECIDWKKVVEKFDRPGTVHYLDPPYVETGDQFYSHRFSLEDMRGLSEFLKSMKNAVWFLSHNIHRGVLELFADFPVAILKATSGCSVKGHRNEPKLELLISNCRGWRGVGGRGGTRGRTFRRTCREIATLIDVGGRANAEEMLFDECREREASKK